MNCRHITIFRGLVLALLPIMVGCSDFNAAQAPRLDHPVSYPISAASGMMRSRTGLMLPEATGKAIMARVARQVALALGDAGLRSNVYEALQDSPFPEQQAALSHDSAIDGPWSPGWDGSRVGDG